MALANYSDLVSALSEWLNRDDKEALYPTFIALFEARANRALRVPQMEESATSPTSEAELSLPDDFLSLRDIRVDGDAVYGMAPQALRDRFQDREAGTPEAYAILGTTIQLAPAPSASVEVAIDYYQTIPALTSTNTVNWLLTAYPDAYLYGVLAVAYDYLRDDNQAGSMLALSDRLLGEIGIDAARRRLPAGPLVARGTVLDG